MNHLKKIFLVFILILIPTVTQAQETTVADVLGDKEIDETLITELDQAEEERAKNFENQLLLSIPEKTDNPSHILTFTDPSPDKDGVQLEIDGDKYVEIKSPYTLPALSIGNHVLKFKFTDDEGALQTLEKELIVIPRPPIFNAPEFIEDSIKLTGSTLANSEVIILITQDAVKHVETVTSNSDGTFEYSYTPEVETTSVFNVSAYTRKYGYASNLSELKTFSRSTSDNSTDTDTEKVVFSISSLSHPEKILKDSPDLVILTGIVLALGILIGVILSNIFSKKDEVKKIKKLEKEITSKKAPEKKELTLRERLAQEEKPEESKPEKKEKKSKTKKTKTKKEKNKKSAKVEKEESKKEEKVLSKEEFMKDFKSFDPDKETGKEVKVKVSLTSNNQDEN